MTKTHGLQIGGLCGGPILALIVYALLPAQFSGESEAALLDHAGRATAAVAVWMATWWMTEAIPLYATALLPLALFPLFGIASMHDAAAPYAHELIYLFMGGFVLALSMQRWNLDRRIALLALQRAGSSPTRIVGAFMLVTATLSMWVSNTATAVMMLPIAIGVIELVGERTDRTRESPFAICLLLGIAYSASIGGVGTLIGTPPNLFLASYASTNLGIEIGFVRWMGIGLALVAILLPITWLLLTRVLYPAKLMSLEGGTEFLARELRDLGPAAPGEKVTLTIFGLTAMAWITRPWLSQIEILGAHPLSGLTDPGIAICAALALFVIPAKRAPWVSTMDWETANRLPWGLLVLFGGGLSLAAAIRANGLGEYLGHSVGSLAGVPSLVLILGVVAMMIFLTEITSNTATAAALVPILAGLAPGLRIEPLLLIVPAAIAASCAFMLPVATPPNAVVFGSGFVPLPQMARAGIWLNLIGIIVITGLCYALVLPLLGMSGSISG
jgi:sodium-dependent dicarboxylate transporter 2/3/5